MFIFRESHQRTWTLVSSYSSWWEELKMNSSKNRNTEKRIKGGEKEERRGLVVVNAVPNTSSNYSWIFPLLLGSLTKGK